MTVPTYMVSFVGGPLADTAGELRHLAPIGLDGDRGRGVYREVDRGPDGDVVFEWESVPPGRRLIEPHLTQLPAASQEDIGHGSENRGRTRSSSLSGRPVEPLADASGGGPSAFPGRDAA